MFEYLRKHEMFRVVFDPFQPKVDESAFALGATYWKNFYGYIKEYLPLGMPDPLVKSSHTTCFVNSDHSGNVATQHLHTSGLIYVNNVPIIWFSKH